MSTIKKISDLLKEELELLKNENKHYETSFYGPHNSLLFHYFPFNHGFIIKPQQQLHAQVIKARLLQPPDTNNPSPNSNSDQSDDSSYSLDSNSQHVTTGDGDLLPDFGISVSNGPGQHPPFLLWEIKRDNSRTKGSLQQMGYYVNWLCNYHLSLMLKSQNPFMQHSSKEVLFAYCSCMTTLVVSGHHQTCQSLKLAGQ